MTLSVLALVMCVGLATAASLSHTTPVYPSQVEYGVGTFTITFNLENAGLEATLDWTGSAVSGGNAQFVLPTQTYIGEGQTISDSATVNYDDDYSGTITGSLVADPSGSGSSAIIGFMVNVLPDETFHFCALEGGANSNQGDLEIKDIKVTNNGLGDKNDWVLLDEVEVEVEIKNDGNGDIDDIIVEWGLYDGDVWVTDIEEEDDFNLKENKDKTLTLTFKLDDDMLEPDFEDELDAGTYQFYVRATGVIDDDESTYDKDDTCAEEFEEIELIIEDDFVILDDIQSPETALCGGTVQILADVYNFADEQEDVLVTINNKELGINNVEIKYDEMDEFDSEALVYEFTVPKDAEEMEYYIDFRIYEDGSIYDNDNYPNGKDAQFVVKLTVDGGCSLDSQVAVSAVLESEEIKAGEELVIKATVTNTGSNTKTLGVSLNDIEDWAEVVDISPATVTLDAGESEDVTLTLMVNKGVSGSKNFNINLVDGNGNELPQPVTVTVEDSNYWSRITGAFGGTNDSGSGLMIALMLGIITILIIIIIIVAVRIARR